MRAPLKVVVLVVSLLLMALPSLTSAASRGPVIDHWTDREVLPVDDFFVWVCGVETSTKIAETDTLKTWPDGSQTFHTERSYIPSDPRLPIERGACSTPRRSMYATRASRTDS